MEKNSRKERETFVFQMFGVNGHLHDMPKEDTLV